MRALALLLAALPACGRIGFDAIGAAGDQAQDAGGPGPSSLTNGLVAYWRLDVPAGRNGRVDDSSGNANHAVAESVSPTDWRPGRIGGALWFGKAGWLRTTFGASYNDIKDGITIATWIRLDRIEGREQVILQRQAGTGDAVQYALRMRGGRPTLDGAATGACEGPALPVDRWVHLAASHDGGTQRLAYDGQEVRACPASGGFAEDTTSVTVGAPQIGPGPFDVDRNRALRATLDEVLLYSRALTATELQALAAGQLPPL